MIHRTAGCRRGRSRWPSRRVPGCGWTGGPGCSTTGTCCSAGAPPRLLYLAPAARARLLTGTLTVTDPTSAALARRLLDAGIAHPLEVPAAAVPARGRVTVVVPVKDRPAGLARLLAALPAGLGGGDRGRRRLGRPGRRSAPWPSRPAPGSCATRAPVARPPRATPGWPRRPRRWWPSSTPTWCPSRAGSTRCWPRSPTRRSGWPRRGSWRCRRSPGGSGRYEAVRSSLDLGPDPALVVPRSRVAYVPSAALVVRRAAVGAGFDEGLQVAEDVDLVLRLHAAGLAAALRSGRAGGARPPHRVRGLVAAQGLLRDRRRAAGGAAPRRRAADGAHPDLGRDRRAAADRAPARRAGRGGHRRAWRPAAGPPVADAAAAGHRRRGWSRWVRWVPPAQTADAVNRHYWPVSLLACLLSRRARRTVLAVALAEGVVDWWRHRDRDPRVRPDPAGHLLAHRLDDLAYGAGLWWGAVAAPQLGAAAAGRAGDAQPSPPTGLVRKGEDEKIGFPLLRGFRPPAPRQRIRPRSCRPETRLSHLDRRGLQGRLPCRGP